MLKPTMKTNSEHPLDAPPANPLDAPRAVLLSPNASVAELEAALAAATSMRERDDAAIAATAAQRANAIVGSGTAAEIDAELEALDKATTAASRRRDVADATATAIAERLRAARQAEVEKRKREAYDKAAARREALAPRLDDLIAKSTKEWRGLLREFYQLELAIREANEGLPQGAQPILSAERLRDAEPCEPEVEIREFAQFIDEDGRVFAEEGSPGVSAKRSPDGKYDVRIGTAEWTGGQQWPHRIEYRHCRRVDYVDIATTTRRPSRALDPIALEIAIPAARVGSHAGWAPSDIFSSPFAILNELNRLEALGPQSLMQSDTETKRMRADEWRKREAAA